MNRRLRTVSLVLTLAVAAAAGPPSLPYHGYCSQTCQPCWSNDTPPCPPDPETGIRQTCTRIQIC